MDGRFSMMEVTPSLAPEIVMTDPVSSTTQSFTDFARSIELGARPIVTFGPRAEELETYAETNMRARVIGTQVSLSEDTVELLVDYSEFETDNAPFEGRGYYGAKQLPTLSAREAGHYKPQEWLYVSASDAIDGWFVIADNASLALHIRFRASGTKLPYVSWLESLVVTAAARA